MLILEAKTKIEKTSVCFLFEKKPKCQTYYFRLVYHGNMLPVGSEAVCSTKET